MRDPREDCSDENRIEAYRKIAAAILWDVHQQMGGRIGRLYSIGMVLAAADYFSEMEGSRCAYELLQECADQIIDQYDPRKQPNKSGYSRDQ
jgi:hypothetical protein